MKTKYLHKVFILLLLFSYFLVPLYGQTNGVSQTQDTITIVFLELKHTGGVEESDVRAINEFLNNAISGLPQYRVIEQNQITEIMSIVEQQQLSGLYDLSSVNTQIKILGAEQVILGSIGRLFDRIVISVRLVEVTNGEIIFSYTIHSTEDQLPFRMEEIVERVREFGILRFQTIRLTDVYDLVRRRRYAEAQERLEAFYRQERRENRPVERTQELLNAEARINANLFEDFFRQARAARRRNDFIEARRLISRAISIQPSSRALEERDRIIVAQAAYDRERENQNRLIELRVQEQEERLRAGNFLSTADSIRLYYEQLPIFSSRLGATTYSNLGKQLELPTFPDTIGLQFLHTFGTRTEKPQQFISLHAAGAFALSIDYQDDATNSFISLQTTFSPLTGFAFKFFHFLTTIGIDGGMLLQYFRQDTDVYNFYPLVGIYGVTDLMILKNFGFHFGARLDHGFNYSTQDRGPWLLRLFAGLSL